MADGGVALDSDGESEIDASSQTHLSQRQKDWHLMKYIFKDTFFLHL